MLRLGDSAEMIGTRFGVHAARTSPERTCKSGITNPRYNYGPTGDIQQAMMRKSHVKKPEGMHNIVMTVSCFEWRISILYIRGAYRGSLERVYVCTYK